MNPTWRVVKKKDGSRRKLLVNCGKCLECMKAYSSQWAYRCVQEAKKYKDNCFVTLTYNEEHLPVGGTLRRSDLQKFIKRLRKKIYPQKVRFFYCGEYGKRGKRPHYHIMLFGWKPDDMVFFKYDKRDPLFRSRILENLWSIYFQSDTGKALYNPIGFVSVGDITFDSAMYCAKYLQKLVPTPPGCIPSFVGMSRRPGLGFDALSPQLLLDNGIYYHGKNISVPRYFIDKLSESHDLDDWKEKRYQASVHRYLCTSFKIRKEKFIKYSELLLTCKK